MREHHLKRRGFLKGAFGLAGGAASLSMSGGLLGALAPALAHAQFADYRALVCVYLSGGNDSFNWLVPSDSVGHAVYAEPRGALSIPRTSLLPIQPLNGLSVGLHPSCSGLQALFGEGDAAFIANCGVLLEPTSKADYNMNRALPPSLFSHSDQQDHWLSARPGAAKSDPTAAGQGGDSF